MHPTTIYITLFLIIFLFQSAYSSKPSRTRATRAPSSPSGEIEFTYSGTDFVLFSNSLSWEDAEQRCILAGGHLATIESEAENSNITSFYGTGKVWIGLDSKQTEGNWKWVEDKSPPSFTNWKSGEPSSPETSRCTVLDLETGEWESSNCNLNLPYLCRMSPPGECPWLPSQGASPKPLLEYSFEGQDILLSVTAARKINHESVHYSISYLDDNYNCRTSDNLPSGWTTSASNCTVTFTARMSIDDFIMEAHAPVSTYNATALHVEKLLRIRVDVDDPSGALYSCSVSKFESLISFKTIGTLDTIFAFNRTEIAQTRVTTLSNNERGELVAEILLRPSDEDYWFSNFEFGKHSAGIDFLVTAEPYGTSDDFDTHEYYYYFLTLKSTEAFENYAGQIIIYFDFNFRDQYTERTYLILHLNYMVLDDPDVATNVVNTVTEFYDETYENEVETFSPFETAHVLTTIDSDIGIPFYDLIYDDVYLCCTKSRIPLAPYDPERGDYGCTVRDDSTMSYWTQLISDGQVNSEMGVQIANFGPFTPYKVGMQFNPIGLYGDDKLCYLFTRVSLYAIPQQNQQSYDSRTIVDSAHAHDASKVTKEKMYEMESSAAFTVQSCSSFSSEEQCMSAYSFCDWHSGSRTCTQKYSEGTSDASQVMKSSSMWLFVVAAALYCNIL